MPTSPALAAAVAETRAALGLNDVPSSWTYAERTAYNKARAARIQANPTAYSPESLTTAEAVARANYAPLESLGVGEAAGIFVGEVVSQAESLNPLSERNRGGLAMAIVSGLIVAAIAYAVTLAFRTPTPKEAK